jgi:hypothetical protein
VGTSLVAARMPRRLTKEVTFVDPEGIARTVTVRNCRPVHGVRPQLSGRAGHALRDAHRHLSSRPRSSRSTRSLRDRAPERRRDAVGLGLRPRPADSTIPDLQPRSWLGQPHLGRRLRSPRTPSSSASWPQPTFDRLLDLAELVPGAAPAPGGRLHVADRSPRRSRPRSWTPSWSSFRVSAG